MALATLEVSDGIALVTMNRPEAMNALSRALQNETSAAIKAAEADETVRVIILTGAGTRAFSAGLDLKEVGTYGLAMGPDGQRGEFPVGTILQCKKPVIGAINGVAVTGGFEVALACDMLIASSNARFSDTHVRVGVTPGGRLSQMLSRTIGIYRAKEMSLSGNYIDAQTACAWGLVSRVVAPEELIAAARKLAADIATCDPDMVKRYKALIDDGFDLPFGKAMDLEHERATADNAKVTAESVEQRRTGIQQRGRVQKA